MTEKSINKWGHRYTTDEGGRTIAGGQRSDICHPTRIYIMPTVKLAVEEGRKDGEGEGEERRGGMWL